MIFRKVNHKLILRFLLIIRDLLKLGLIIVLGLIIKLLVVFVALSRLREQSRYVSESSRMCPREEITPKKKVSWGSVYVFFSCGVVSAGIRVLNFKVEFCFVIFVICSFFIILFNITVMSFVKTRGTWCWANVRTKLFVLVYCLSKPKLIGHVLQGS